MTPSQGWSTRFVPWAELRRKLSEMANIPKKTLDCAVKRFSAGHIFDIELVTRASHLQKMGFERQTA